MIPTQNSAQNAARSNKKDRQTGRTLNDSFKLNRICNLPTEGQRAICFLSFLFALRRVIKSLPLEGKGVIPLIREMSLATKGLRPAKGRDSGG